MFDINNLSGALVGEKVQIVEYDGSSETTTRPQTEVVRCAGCKYNYAACIRAAAAEPRNLRASEKTETRGALLSIDCQVASKMMTTLPWARSKASHWLLCGLALANSACSNGTPSAVEPPDNGTSGAEQGGAPAAAGSGGAPAAAGSGGAPAAAGASDGDLGGAPPDCALGMGALKKIYVPKPSANGTAWYINDHTVIRGPDNLWHMIGITHEEPMAPLSETMLAHATSPSLTASNWTQLPPALTADPAFGETQLWAPYIIEVDGVFYMFYCGGGVDGEHYQIELATSTDLSNWTREPKPLFIDGYQARDPFVLRVNEQWVLYYTATITPSNGFEHTVSYRTSPDLRTWSDANIAYIGPDMGMEGGLTESPFVVARGGGYYLFTGPRNDYSSTIAFYSTDPLHFDPAGAVPTEQMPTLLPTHASEIVVDLDGKFYITSAGWGQGGLSIAQLAWPCP
jgi:arabinan endo-1,5-alpha-L-arabinosidase